MSTREGARQDRASPKRRRARASRDQGESAFASILASLVASVPGARGAVLVDLHGETVDYAGEAPPFDLRVAAAHFRIVLNEAAAQPSLVGLDWLVVRAARKSYLIHALPDGYALVLLFARAAGFVGWHRAVVACRRALDAEAGWKWSGSPATPWFRFEVVSDGRRRPRSVRVAGRLRPVEILGVLAEDPGSEQAMRQHLTRGERGWRVRFETGMEVTLIREPGGFWYSDEPLDAALKAPG
jgi:hypothetical protein